MKKLLLISAFFVVASCSLMFAFVSNTDLNKNDSYAGRGCCSHHGGVCGCSYGRAVCCDGSYSPSCQCFKDDIQGTSI
jgi:hypothetical protein